MDLLLLGLAGVLGGALNALAGGGSFVTLAALVCVGLPPVVANATGTAALLPGYVVSAWRFRRDLAVPRGVSLSVLLSLTLLGGSVGAGILLHSSAQLFAALVPWLVLLATAMFALAPMLLRRQRPASTAVALVSLFAVCVYGGYFNGGLGIILLAALSLLGQRNLAAMNGLKNAMSALLTAVAVAVYWAGGLIALPPLLILAGAAIVGGYAGAALSYRIPAAALRGFIVAVGLALALLFFLR